MKELTLELTHELLYIAESGNTQELLEEFLALYGYDESRGE
jgi:hypothetical protein